MFPVPVESYPTNGVQHPEHRQVERVPCGDIASTATAWTIAGERITEVLFIGHQFRTTRIQSTLNEYQGGGVDSQSESVVNLEIARSNGQEQGICSRIDSF